MRPSCAKVITQQAAASDNGQAPNGAPWHGLSTDTGPLSFVAKKTNLWFLQIGVTIGSALSALPEKRSPETVSVL